METIKADNSLIWKSQRQLEPASFWMALLLGSIALHGLGWVVLRPLLKTLQPPSVESVAIDFVELPTPLGNSVPQAKASPQSAIVQAPSPPVTSPAAPEAPIIPSASLTPTITVPPSPLPLPASSVRQPPAPPPSQPQPSVTQPTKVPMREASLPSVPTVPPVSNDLQRNVSPNGGEGAALAIASGGIGTSTDSSLPTVSVTQQRTQSSGLKLTVLAVSQIVEDSLSTDTAGNSPPENLTPAQPKELTQTFPDLVYPASIALNLGRPIQLRVEINSEGQASPIEVRQGSAANDLDNLVQDLIREIPFNPATQSGKPVSSWVDISLKLDPL